MSSVDPHAPPTANLLRDAVKFVGADVVGDGGRDCRCPGEITGGDFREKIVAVEGHDFFIVARDRLEEPVAGEVLVEAPEVGGDLEIAGGDHDLGLGIALRVEIEFDGAFEEASEGFQDAAAEGFVVVLGEEGLEFLHAHGEGDGLLGEPLEEGAEAEVFRVFGNHGRVSECGEHLGAGDEIGGV